MTNKQFIEAVITMLDNIPLDELPWEATSFCTDSEAVMWQVDDYILDYKEKLKKNKTKSIEGR